MVQIHFQILRCKEKYKNYREKIKTQNAFEKRKHFGFYVLFLTS